MNEDLQRVEDALNVLSEHFDSVHIFATRHEPEIEEGTVAINRGIGNWYARYGQVHEWVVKQDEYNRINCRKEE